MADQTSTMNAEYMAACAATQESMFAKSRIDHCRSTHIDVRYHFVNEMIAEKRIVMKHVANEFQLADMLTRALATPTFVNLGVMMVEEWTRRRRRCLHCPIYDQERLAGLVSMVRLATVHSHIDRV